MRTRLALAFRRGSALALCESLSQRTAHLESLRRRTCHLVHSPQGAPLGPRLRRRAGRDHPRVLSGHETTVPTTGRCAVRLYCPNQPHTPTHSANSSCRRATPKPMPTPLPLTTRIQPAQSRSPQLACHAHRSRLRSSAAPASCLERSTPRSRQSPRAARPPPSTPRRQAPSRRAAPRRMSPQGAGTASCPRA